MSAPRFSAAEVVEAYEDGRTMPEIQAVTGWSYRRVRSCLLEAGVEMRPAMPVTPPAPPGLVERYESGASIEATAVEFGLSYGVARRMLLNAGVVLRTRGRPALGAGGRGAPR